MELKIINKKADPLLSRIKVEAELTFDKGTPSNAEVRSMLSKDLGKDEKLIVVKNIYTTYGLTKATNLSYIYENEEALKRIEVQKKEKTGKKEAKSDEGATEKPQEAKKEEKQEKKAEEKEAKKKEKSEKKEAKSEEKPKEQKAPEKDKK